MMVVAGRSNKVLQTVCILIIAVAMRGLFVRSLFVAVVVLLTACRVTSTGGMLGPAVGEQPWWYVRTKHFHVRSDTGRDETAEIAADLERFYRLLFDLGFPMEKDPGFVTDVIVFRTKEAYQRIGPNTSAGFYQDEFGSLTFARPTFVTFGGISEAARRTFIHELTHRFVHYAVPQIPVWMNEGLAEYYETIEVDNGKATLGRTFQPFKRGESWTMTPYGIPIDALPSVADIMAMSPKEFYAGRSVSFDDDSSKARDLRNKQVANYQSAWSLIHLLKNSSPDYADRFEKWLQRLAAGEPVSTSFDAAFSGISVEKLQAERAAMLDKLALRDIQLLRTDYKLEGEPALESRAMRPAEVSATWGWALLEKGKSELAAAEQQARAAVESEPNSVEAHHLLAAVHLAKKDATAAQQEIDKAYTQNPNDEAAAYGKFIFATQFRGTNDAAARGETAERIATEWATRTTRPDMLNSLAWYFTKHRQAAKALPMVQRAVQMEPSCAVCFDTLAVALFRTGDYRAAVSAQTLAVAVEGEGSNATSFQQRLDVYQAVQSAVVLAKKRPDPNDSPDLIPKAVLAAVMNAAGPDVDECYQIARLQNKDLEGSVFVQVVVDSAGKVAEVKSPAPGADTPPSSLPHITDPEMTQCVLSEVQSLHFPAALQGARLTFPFQFQKPK
ncbi:MAG: AgmX/PglI C-terminal domain-containing protein [Polyangiaceae bacterium]|nr:AgmX/PglI C-terminal domain-containing protein [Polyangiaceae bacterium]